MTYTVKEVAQLTGISIRTLHYYDEIGLLKPAFYGGNGYRYYEKAQMLRLQQILFYRELDFGLNDIIRVMNSDTFDQLEALQTHKKQISQQRNRMSQLLDTIDKTIEHLKGEAAMKSEDLYLGFDSEKQAKYENEITEKYGSEIVEESKRSTKNWKKEDYAAIKAGFEDLNKQLAEEIVKGAHVSDRAVQVLIGKHFALVSQSYKPTKVIYSGLGHMYVEHPEFRSMYDAHQPALAEFLRDAMQVYADEHL
ncbi:MerR family transcriptional regulator [Paenibacillus sp. N3.4]|nr:MerR family transcriptional regulator [Paenibacillus sp. N3.4]